MNTPSIIKEVSLRMGCTKKDCRELLDHFVDLVNEKLATGEKISYVGLGKFYTKNGHGKKRAKFKACKRLSRGVSENGISS